MNRIAVIGQGRLGGALSAALRAADYEVDGPLGRGATGADADAVFLCVPDRSIAAAAQLVEPARGRLVGHCSGVTGLMALVPHEGFSLHPLVAVADYQSQLQGGTCAVDGTSVRARRAAAEFARRLGMRAIKVSRDRRDLYHALAVLASTGLVAIEESAALLGREVGLDRKAVAHLARSALCNWERLGAAGLTGPLTRGDGGASSLGRQRGAIARASPQLLPLWDVVIDVARQGTFPAPEHCYVVEKDVEEEIKKLRRSGRRAAAG